MQGKTKQVRFRNMVAYGFGDLFGGGSFFIIGTLFMVFLTDVVGLSPVEAGTIVALGKVWDALLDPTIGYISDHLQTKKDEEESFFFLESFQLLSRSVCCGFLLKARICSNTPILS
ncbi:MFS transporter [Priestia sp. OVS21]|nr:MFS transporter [Priestia sp. OVS21]